MDKEQKISNNIKKLLRGTITIDELKEINQWYDSFDPKQEIIIENSSGSKEVLKKEMLTGILNEINKKNSRLKIFNIPQFYLRAAASIAFLILLSAGLVYFIGRADNKPLELIWQYKTTAIGEKSIITLSDGSKITLNAASKIKYPLNFTEGRREIYLEGEAFFEVIHDSKNPFEVHTGQITTTDLGTKFNIKAFANSEIIAVSLVEGKISVLSENMKSGIMLEPSRKFSFNKNKLSGTVDNFDRDETIGWIDNILVFHKEPLKNVLAGLTRMYGIEFTLTDALTGDKEITANFRKESYKTVAEAIRKAAELKYKTENDNNGSIKIVFYK